MFSVRKGSRDAEATMQQRLRAAFDEFDMDGDGMLDPGELKALLLNHGHTPEPPLSEDGVRLVLASIDKDKDSLVSFNEFAQWVCGKKESTNLLLSIYDTLMPLLDEPGMHGYRGLAVGMIFHSKYFINKMPCVYPPHLPPPPPSHYTAP
jgi:hypothetical protein